MPAPDLSVIVPPLAQARSLEPSSENSPTHQVWSGPGLGAAYVAVLATHTKPRIVLNMPYDSPAYVGLVELVSEIRLAIGDAS